MSQALAHFAFGAAMTTLLLTLLPTTRYPRTVVLAGGTWAMVPDVHWVSPVARESLRRFHQASPVTDVFWLHRTLDRLDPTDAPEVAAGFLGFLVVVTLVAERRDYRSPRLLQSVYETYLDSEEE